ncbi:uncharacterized protein SPPG_09424 [Spizellomyces punctatus DAOM BR117]|uniref:Uncharacterized protein n=1 Tax=Spizellomyces punctatus (strain DAOM BR117) TaxID=645134 RepID=A0A0L0HB67_SPIPD|nr:uncharacterized protein SPPG_09424 [Spizellomyces punctatus DAOM BR117]KNC97963.1 hypothetical protein SPPG_09424 [Spizellomyces punctatus DAOM BR117]|eukprot:XP_016606003.1 hypothetical protein SPPG_09424 [Spizellomyces punctatus DAOM BR117]
MAQTLVCCRTHANSRVPLLRKPMIFSRLCTKELRGRAINQFREHSSLPHKNAQEQHYARIYLYLKNEHSKIQHAHLKVDRSCLKDSSSMEEYNVCSNEPHAVCYRLWPMTISRMPRVRKLVIFSSLLHQRG